MCRNNDTVRVNRSTAPLQGVVVVGGSSGAFMGFETRRHQCKQMRLRYAEKRKKKKKGMRNVAEKTLGLQSHKMHDS